ncbi:MAG: phosphatidylglycerol lysyltransferase domain-containing protein [Omnitrophica WOR_2 bacterium]
MKVNSNSLIKSLTFLSNQRRIILQFSFTALFIGLGIWFFYHEQNEISQVQHELATSRVPAVLIGVVLAALTIITHSFMYRAAFASLEVKLSYYDGIILFLKRNFISVFLPAGGVSSLAFFTQDIEKAGVPRTKIHFASSVYGFIGIVSVVVVAIPVFIHGLATKNVSGNEWIALLSVILLMACIYMLFLNLVHLGWSYRLIKRYYPPIEVIISDLNTGNIQRQNLFECLAYSILIEIWGILQLYVAANALGIHLSFMTCAMGYLISILFMIISPFMRGLGAVEFSLTYTLTRFDLTMVEAISVTALYRFFEFWIPLVSGVLSFMAKANKLLLRVLPATLMFFLGIVNIISVLTPAISGRLHLLRDYIPAEAIHASNYFVLFSGLLLLVNSAFMIKGLKSAWWFALLLSVGSLVGHLTKAIDYEEATLAFAVVLSLFYTRKEYIVKSNPQLRKIGIQTALISMLAVLLYGIIGFYFLDKKHFNINFNLIESVRYTLAYYFLIGSKNLIPTGQFASFFMDSIRISGFLSLSFIFYTLINPYVLKRAPDNTAFDEAKAIVKAYGNSSMDYFKTYKDKSLFFNTDNNCFISYKASGNFAVILEAPVGMNDDVKRSCLRSFCKYCFSHGLHVVSYRVPKESLHLFESLKMKSIFIGQEGVVDLESFTLQGGDKKRIRNAINKVKESGFKLQVYEPPLKDGLMQKLKAVSDSWLQLMERNEMCFSQGIFAWEEIKNQTVLVAENEEDKIAGFLNIIPDYAYNEGTFDLIRKTGDAPLGVIDFLHVAVFDYFKEKNIRYVNLGFAPLSGIDLPADMTERSMKFAYEKIKSFAHYKGLRESKEKFTPIWYDRYLVYEHDFELLQIPAILNKVFKI